MTLTPEQIKIESDKLKALHGKVYEVTVPLDEDDETKTATLILKKPDRGTYALISKLLDTDTIKATEGALKSMYVGGDKLDIVLENIDALVSCETAIVQIIRRKGATIKKN